MIATDSDPTTMSEQSESEVATIREVLWEVALDMAGSYVRSGRFDDAQAILETLLYGEPRAATQEALGQVSFLTPPSRPDAP